MKLDLYQVDAFAKEVFKGNPAAVVPLDRWLSAQDMQSIARENNLSETAFFCPNGEYFDIRWFTPNGEVELCGHATMAAAFVFFNFIDNSKNKIIFKSLYGDLVVQKSGDLFKMDFPAQNPAICELPKMLVNGLGAKPEACYQREDYLAVFKSEKDLRLIRPDFKILSMLDSRGVIITAPGHKYDFVSRAFFPKYGIHEDPVTGSAHTKLIPYWYERTGRKIFTAKQISKRGGIVFCQYNENRVYISGYARLYMKGEILIP